MYKHIFIKSFFLRKIPQIVLVFAVNCLFETVKDSKAPSYLMHIPLYRPLVLASNSPRRRQLLAQCGFTFSTEVRPTDEVFPKTMPPDEVAAFLARKKAEEFQQDAHDNLILCADTIVVKDDLILNKPSDEKSAIEMLELLSGASHHVVTGVCLLDNGEFITKTDTAKVTFRKFTTRELEFYVKYQPPFDKAGGYGIQDWIGLTGIERIEGSYYTIMGLPTHLVYEMLRPYFGLGFRVTFTLLLLNSFYIHNYN